MNSGVVLKSGAIVRHPYHSSYVDAAAFDEKEICERHVAPVSVSNTGMLSSDGIGGLLCTISIQSYVAKAKISRNTFFEDTVFMLQDAYIFLRFYVIATQRFSLQIKASACESKQLSVLSQRLERASRYIIYGSQVCI